MSIHKFVLIVFWAIIWTWVPSMASTIPGNPAIRMALGVVGYLMNLRTILAENKLRMVQDMAHVIPITQLHFSSCYKSYN